MAEESTTEKQQPAASPPKRERVESIDAFRGFTILGMVFVIGVAAFGYMHEEGGLPQTTRWFGSPQVSTWFHAEVGWDLWCEEQIEHLKGTGAISAAEFDAANPADQRVIAQEHLGEHHLWPMRHIGVTFTDLIAPWFVFIVGVCIPLSRRKRGAEFWSHALSRTLMLILVGMLYISLVIRQVSPWWGVLQAIGVAYFMGVLVTLLPSAGRWVAVFAVGLLHLVLTAQVPAWTQNPHWFPEWSGQVWAEIPRPFWSLSDPTGSEKRVLIIHCLPWLSISYGVMTMIGVLLGEVIRDGRDAIIRRAGLLSVIFIVLGYAIHKVGLLTGDFSLCMNKPEVTTSYAFFTAGTGALCYLLFYLIMDVWKVKFWARPLQVFGANALLAYFMMIIMRRAFDALGITSQDGMNGISSRVTGGNAVVHRWAEFFGGVDPATSQPIASEAVLDLFRKSGYHGVMWGLIWTFCLWLIVLFFNRRKWYWKL